MSKTSKRVNYTKAELEEHLATKSEIEKTKQFWDEIRTVEDKYNYRIRALINPNIIEGIRPVLTCVPVDKIGIKAEEPKDEPTEPTNKE